MRTTKKKLDRQLAESSHAGKRYACRRFLLVAYAVVVILLATYPSNVLLLALLFGRHPRSGAVPASRAAGGFPERPAGA